MENVHIITDFFKSLYGYNKICGIDEKSPFVDIQNVIFNKILKISGTLYKWPLILLVILIDIYYISK